MGIASSTLACLLRLFLRVGTMRSWRVRQRGNAHGVSHAADRNDIGVPTRASMPRPLRVVRVIDARQGPGGAGRMVISGRMADVCAELERLAALEAASAGA